MIRSGGSATDLEYVIDAHKTIYTAEYRYDSSFVRYVTDAVNDFAQTRDTERENVWILEMDQRPKGCVAIVQAAEGEAQLRWFLIEPEARGRGYGRRLLQEAIRFCVSRHYKTVFLWTNSSLTAARALYEACGFRITTTQTRTLSNQTLREEKWELVLQPKPGQQKKR